MSTEEGAQYVAKWNILFDRTQSHWMLLNPEEGAHVYPCYACRDLFSSRASFVDHVNRISIGLKYYCPGCSTPCSFYNPCTLLLHARKHFNPSGGVINLDNMEVYHLPLGLIGFPPHPDVPLIFDIKEEESTTRYINSSFYNPMGTQKGSKLVKLVATYLLFFNTKAGGNKSSMVLKQVCKNIPKCVFIVTNATGKFIKDNVAPLQYIGAKNYDDSSSSSSSSSSDTSNTENSNNNLNSITIEEETKSVLYKTVDIKINKPADNKEDKKLFKCPECGKVVEQTGFFHFQQGNIPSSSDFQCETCDFISPGLCSFRAHNRVHHMEPPFICPECGIAYDKFLSLLDHQNTACYHFAKQVRLRCTKKHCSKIFTYHINYKQHFLTHLQGIMKCPKCLTYYSSQKEFNSHLKADHKNENITSVEAYQCNACDNRKYTKDEYKEHVEWHCDPNRVNNRVYVYICRHCRNYFRTPTTYATHLVRCSKKDIMLAEFVSMKFGPTMTYCMNCGFIVLFKIWLTNCLKCGTSENLFHHSSDSMGAKKLRCTLCCDVVCQKSQHKCKFEKPVVVLNNLGNISETVIIPEHADDANFQDKSSPKTDKTVERRKKKSTSPNHQNPKKKQPRTSSENLEITLEAPKPFDGTYTCKLCEFSSAQREDFHGHLLTHRDGALYQCMECGESFVVKPSFEKHLIYFHQIMDVDKYITENNCCDKEVELQNSSDNEPLEENQCKVCRQKFDDEFELKKHFRVHGMAFLLNKSRASNQ